MYVYMSLLKKENKRAILNSTTKNTMHVMQSLNYMSGLWLAFSKPAWNWICDPPQENRLKVMTRARVR